MIEWWRGISEKMTLYEAYKKNESRQGQIEKDKIISEKVEEILKIIKEANKKKEFKAIK
jgi:hypothetical protein